MLDLKQMISGLKKPVVPDRISNFLTDTAGHDPNASLGVGSGRPLMETGSIQDPEPADDFNLPKLLAQSAATAFKQPAAPQFVSPGQPMSPRYQAAPLRTNYQLPRFDQGGFLPVGRKGIVGGRNRRTGNTEEQIEVTPGGVQITPIDPLHPDQSAIQKYGMPGTLPTFTPPAPAPIASPGGVPLPAPIAGRPMDNAALGAPTNEITGTVREPTRDEQIAKYEQELIAAPEKPNKFLSGLFLALQGVDKIFSPNNKPIVSLAEARKEERNRGLLPKLEVLKGQRKAEQEAAESQAKIDAPKQRAALKREEVAARVSLEQQKFENRVKRDEAKAKAEGGKWKPYTDENGLRWKEFPGDSTKEREPIIDPLTNEQDVDPNYKLYDYTDPATNTTVKLTGRVLSDRGVRQAEFNARQEQGAATTNANNSLEAARANATNQFNYSKALFDRMTELGKTNAEVQGANAAAQGLYTQIEQAATQLQSIDPSDEKGYAAAQKNFNDLQEKFYQSVSKTQAGSALVQQMAAQGLTRPPTVNYTPVRASKVTTGKPVPPSKDPLGIFR